MEVTLLKRQNRNVAAPGKLGGSHQDSMAKSRKSIDEGMRVFVSSLPPTTPTENLSEHEFRSSEEHPLYVKRDHLPRSEPNVMTQKQLVFVLPQSAYSWTYFLLRSNYYVKVTQRRQGFHRRMAI